MIILDGLYDTVKEANLKGIKRKQKSVTQLFPTFFDRVRKVEDLGGIRLRDQDDDNWHFKVHSGTKKDVWYDCTLHFKNIERTLSRLVKDRRFWLDDRSRIDLRKLATKFAEIIDVQVFCSCPAFQYWGPAYIMSRPRYNAKYTKPEYRPPKKRNPKQYGAVCKHYQAVLKALPFYTGTLAKWLKDFYSDEIAKYEKEAKEEFGWLKKVAGKLAKKKELVKKPVEEPKKLVKKPGLRKPMVEPEAETEELPEETRESVVRIINEAEGERWVAFDFDGVCATYDGWLGDDVFGDPITDTANFIQELRQLGFKTVLHTCRKVTPALVEYLKVNGFEFDNITTKPIAELYVDDLAVRFDQSDPFGSINVIRSYIEGK